MSTNEPTHSPKDLTKSPGDVFKTIWEEHGIEAVKHAAGTEKGLTPVYNKGRFLKRLDAEREELDEKGLEDAPVFKGMARTALIAASASDDKVKQETLEKMRQKNVIDSNVAERSTPLVFDPEIRQILVSSAPLAQGRWARQGQEGYEAVFNRVDRREDPLGRVPEGVSRRLQDYARDFGLNRETVPMRIYADTAEIGDFAATASAHYMDLEDLTITARMSEYAQFDEQEMLYGRYNLDSLDTAPTGGDAGEFDYAEGGGVDTPLEGGSPLGAYAARGLAEWFRLADDASTNVAEIPNANVVVDESAVSTDILDELKAQIHDLLQGPFSPDPNDLEVWTSYTLYDILENEFIPRARSDENDDELNYGDYTIRIAGVPVIPSHNVDEHEYVAQDEDGTVQDPWDPYDPADAGYEARTVGSEGDAFIVNTSTWRKRELSPLSTFPLAVRGGSDEVAMLAYDGNVELSGGFFGKYLQGFAI